MLNKWGLKTNFKIYIICVFKIKVFVHLLSKEKSYRLFLSIAAVFSPIVCLLLINRNF